MKKKSILICCLAALLLGYSCKKEETPSPSYADINWFVVEDDPDDEIQHLRYEIYKETGITVLTNDILGVEKKINQEGEEYEEIVRVRMGYDLNKKPSKAQWTLNILKDEDIGKVKVFLELLRDWVIPKLPQNARPRSFMIGDYLAKQYHSGWIRYSPIAYRDIMMTVITARVLLKTVGNSQTTELKDRDVSTDDLKREYANAVIATQLGAYITDNYSAQLQAFYKVSATVRYPQRAEGYSPYSTLDDDPVTKINPGTMRETTAAANRMNPDPRYYGFIAFMGSYNTIGSGSAVVQMPIKEGDVTDFVREIYRLGHDQFRATYGSFPLVMEKYNILKPFYDELELP